MSEPFTDDDLRAEAARQMKNATEDPDFVGIGEQMEGRKIPSRSLQWDQLDEDDFDAARRGIDDLISKAADVTKYAVDCGAEDLKPHQHRLIQTEDGITFAAFHLAVDPHCELSPQAIDAIADVIRGDIAFRED